jgi:hypothetical protein
MKEQKPICDFCDEAIEDENYPWWVHAKTGKSIQYHVRCVLIVHEMTCDWILCHKSLECKVMNDLVDEKNRSAQ